MLPRQVLIPALTDFRRFETVCVVTTVPLSSPNMRRTLLAVTLLVAALAGVFADALPSPAMTTSGLRIAVQTPKLLNLTQYESLPLPIRELLAAQVKLGSPWSWIKCEVCKKVIGDAENFVIKHGCGAFDAYAVSLCEAAGIGPEDPLSDICAAALVAGCPIILHEIEKHITNPDTLCKDIHMC